MNNIDYKTKWLNEIFNDHPEVKYDTLKKHIVEQMIDAYLANEKEFKKIAYEAKKNNTELFRTATPEMIAITKIDE